MRIAFVMDGVSVRSSGASATAERYAASLRAQGHEVVCDVIYRLFRDWLYGDARHIHCPSGADRLVARPSRGHRAVVKALRTGGDVGACTKRFAAMLVEASADDEAARGPATGDALR